MRSLASRRKFFQQTFGLAAGSVLFRNLGSIGRGPDRALSTPLIITSHQNETGRRAVEIGWEILASGGRAIDAVAA